MCAGSNAYITRKGGSATARILHHQDRQYGFFYWNIPVQIKISNSDSIDKKNKLELWNSQKLSSCVKPAIFIKSYRKSHCFSLAGTHEGKQSPGHTAICLQKSAQYRNSTSESTEWHSFIDRPEKRFISNPSWPICCLRYSRSWSLAVFLGKPCWPYWICFKFVQNILVWAVTVCVCKWRYVWVLPTDFWSPTRICSWASCILHLHTSFGSHIAAS